MTHSSLFRVIVVVSPLLWACAHEVDDYPETFGADDAEVVGRGGSEPSGSGSAQSALPLAGTTSGGATTSVFMGSGGHAGKTHAGGAAGSAALPSAEAGAGSQELGGAAGAAAESGGGSVSDGGKAGSASNGGSAAGGVAAGGKAGSSSGGKAGSSTGGSSGGVCSGVAKWAAGSYAAGAHVQNGVNLYECKPHPYSGWCGLDAYAPGSGWAWTDAWTLVGPC